MPSLRRLLVNACCLVGLFSDKAVEIRDQMSTEECVSVAVISGFHAYIRVSYVFVG